MQTNAFCEDVSNSCDGIHEGISLKTAVPGPKSLVLLFFLIHMYIVWFKYFELVMVYFVFILKLDFKSKESLHNLKTYFYKYNKKLN